MAPRAGQELATRGRAYHPLLRVFPYLGKDKGVLSAGRQAPLTTQSYPGRVVDDEDDGKSLAFRVVPVKEHNRM